MAHEQRRREYTEPPKSVNVQPAGGCPPQAASQRGKSAMSRVTVYAACLVQPGTIPHHMLPRPAGEAAMASDTGAGSREPCAWRGTARARCSGAGCRPAPSETVAAVRVLVISGEELPAGPHLARPLTLLLWRLGDAERVRLPSQPQQRPVSVMREPAVARTVSSVSSTAPSATLRKRSDFVPTRPNV